MEIIGCSFIREGCLVGFTCNVLSNLKKVSVTLLKDGNKIETIDKADTTNGEYSVSYKPSPMYRNSSGLYSCNTSVDTVFPGGKLQEFDINVACKLFVIRSFLWS